MNIGRACGIFINIESDNFTEDEKLVAIRDVLKEMVTYNGITKDNILKAFRWFFDWAVEETTEDGKDTNVPSKWIPCSEMLPEDIKTVLVTIEESKEPMLGWYGNKFGWRIVAAEFANIKDFTVLAWMPLPEPYKEGEDGNR